MWSIVLGDRVENVGEFVWRRKEWRVICVERMYAFEAVHGTDFCL
jgi:hypothetical protein